MTDTGEPNEDGAAPSDGSVAAGGASHDAAARSHRGGGFVRRHRALTILLALLLVLVAAVGGFGFYVNSQLGQIARFDSQLKDEDRATKAEGKAGEALNILLLGTDKGPEGTTIEEELADGDWNSGSFRSDTMMILHIPADRDQAHLVSLPRDSYVKVEGHGMQKINAAFSYGGPDLAVKTVEDLTGIYIDHVAMVDWAGFKDLTSAIGGVEVTIAETFTDPRNNRVWREGTTKLEGEKALAYVRTRYGLPNGDFDRIQRQQNFLRAVMQKTLSRRTLFNPIKLSGLLNAITKSATVDSDFTTGLMRSLALDLRSLRTSDVVYLTAPTAGYKETDVGSVVLLDKKESDALWRAIRQDRIQRYLNKYGGTTLAAPGKVR